METNIFIIIIAVVDIDLVYQRRKRIDEEIEPDRDKHKANSE